MHNTGVRPQLSITEKVTFMKVAVQFCLHSIILYYNYFKYNSVDKLLIFFQFEFNKVGVRFLFQKCESSQGESFLYKHIQTGNFLRTLYLNDPFPKIT